MRNTKSWLVALLAVALVLAACTPADDTTGTPFATEDLGTEPLATDVMTDAPATEVGTAVVTEVGTAVATQASTAVATEVGTPVPGTTETPTAAADMLLVLSSDLIGFEIVTEDGQTVGQVDEVLVDQSGSVQYVIFDAGGFLGLDPRMTVVPWSMFSIPEGMLPADGTGTASGTAVPDDETQLIFKGTQAEVEALPVIPGDVLDGEEFVIHAGDDAAIPADVNNMIRVGQFTDFDLRNTQDEDLGEVEDLLIDVMDGEVTYAVVDFGGFLGIGEKSVAVPWQAFELNLAADTTTQDFFVLDVPRETLESAPTIDLSEIAIWPESVLPNWDDDIRSFWETVG